MSVSVGYVSPMSHSKKIETKETIFRSRKRIIKYLVLNFLKDEGFTNTAVNFTSEAGITDEYQLCDNIDLDIIFQEYCSYYMMKFNKQPIFIKKVDEAPNKLAQSVKKAIKKSVTPNRSLVEDCDSEKTSDLTLTVTQIKKEYEMASNALVEKKPLNIFLKQCAGDIREMAEQLYRDTVRFDDVTTWRHIYGLEDVKSVLMDSVVCAVKYSDMFDGVLSPWKGILLHGPPGGGKTILAKAVAGESGCTFFNVAPSTLVSKWRGDSEKIIKVLFQLARYYAPSIIFLDEVESVASERDHHSEHEASRRMKSQLLIEVDGLITNDDTQVILLANSNLPWDIDPAMLRRFEKRIFIAPPDENTRAVMFQNFLSQHSNIKLSNDIDVKKLSQIVVGYSGNDIRLICKEAIMTAFRKILPTLGNKGINPKKIFVHLKNEDILAAINKTKPISMDLVDKYISWQKRYGSD